MPQIRARGSDMHYWEIDYEYAGKTATRTEVIEGDNYERVVNIIESLVNAGAKVTGIRRY